MEAVIGTRQGGFVLSNELAEVLVHGHGYFWYVVFLDQFVMVTEMVMAAKRILVHPSNPDPAASKEHGLNYYLLKDDFVQLGTRSLI